MRPCKRLVAVLLLVAGLALAGPAAAGPTCQGRFMNPITDICWSCVFPLTIGSASLLSDGQNDIDNPSTPICYCNNPPRVGVTIGFWEPVRLVDVTRTPFCMVALGGIAIDPGIEVPRGAQVGHDSQASALLTQRMTAKMHRQLATYDGAGAAGLCGYYMQPIMDKTHYKLQMVYPVPNTQKDAGQCCQPYGRTTMIWGAGKSFPVTGEDFSYQIFRKRNCCAGAY